MQQAAKRGRKPKDPQVVLDAVELLLVDRSLHELSVEEILVAADVSRATFYARFPTKFAVARALLDQVLGEISRTMAAYVERPDDASVIDALRKGVDDSTEVWFRHRDLLRTIVENAHAVREFAEPLTEIKRRFSESIAGEIERERAIGLAPLGHDAGELSTALVECTIQLLYSAAVDEATVGQLILELWCGTVYRVPAPPRIAR